MSSSTFSTPITLQPKERHTATLIFLHGLGDSGSGWLSTMKEMQKKLPNFKIILPNAPTRSLTMRGGASMPAWYDRKDSGPGRGEEELVYMDETREYVIKLINHEREMNGIDTIFLGGFSQGCMVSLWVTYQLEFPIAGCIGLSGFLPRYKKDFIGTLFNEKSKSTPLLMCHGTEDTIVDHSLGKLSSDILSKGVAEVDFKSYPGLKHSVNQVELDDITRFLEEKSKKFQNILQQDEL